ncbi:MAG: hypothetical protein M1829_000830 [Trizodia sp. TS-e1964]|nr:MAG: hypothetical protein M1829_000830 [Trizodia sp. TS-e1964]
MATYTSTGDAIKTSNIRPKLRYSGKAFFITIITISTIALLSHVTAKSLLNLPAGFNRGMLKREPTPPIGSREFGLDNSAREEKECRMVNLAADQCTFIQANCIDEDVGFLSYLTLYYCRLPHAKPLAFTIIVMWLGMLFTTIGIAASDFFCINLSTIATILGMSENLAGVTFLAFGNGSPDVFSTFSAMSTNSGSLAVGELIGAAGFITAVVAGSMALVRDFKVPRKTFVRDVVFFIAAASFTMWFLVDGRLQLWECAAMISFYVFYVITVVVWHWRQVKRRRRREREATARSHFYLPGGEQEGDEVDEANQGAWERRSFLRNGSIDDFRALEAGPSHHGLDGEVDDQDEDDEGTRERYLADLNNHMRVRRPRPGIRRSTLTPIRPSLLGALEFRAAIFSLQKSRNLSQSIPIHTRRHSEDLHVIPGLMDQSPRGEYYRRNSNYNMNASEVLDSSRLHTTSKASNNRVRAVSANDATGLDTDLFQRQIVPNIDLLSPTPPPREEHHHFGLDGSALHKRLADEVASSSNNSLSPPGSSQHSRESSLGRSARRRMPTDHLAPPTEDYGYFSLPLTSVASNTSTTGATAPMRHPFRQPRLIIPQTSRSSGASSPLSPFPNITDSPLPLSPQESTRPSSLRLPPPSISIGSTPIGEISDLGPKPIPWWPYSVLPAPDILSSTLFPTLYSWKEKSLWERCLAIIACPSVFLLVITLPVVEIERYEQSDHDLSPQITRHPALREEVLLSGNESTSRPGNPRIIATDSNWGEYQMGVPDFGSDGSHLARSALVLSPRTNEMFPGIEDEAVDAKKSIPAIARQPQSHEHWPMELEIPTPSSSPKEWNRWLVSLQAFTAPSFIVVMVWANSTNELSNLSGLVRPILYSLLASLICLGILVITTSPSEPPRWRFLLCFVGFVVSISWISSIANEVVGVLKAVGVILGISDAILGLTIFAVGNSLGDLVADITVARLGFPVMALSACISSPLMNILLGIGVSGLYLTIRDGRNHHEKHPHKHIKYKPYEIVVSSTLIISAVALLFTLLVLLVAVPLNGWRMNKRIGWGLIAVWSLTTVVNLIVEVTGYGGEI